MLTNIPPHVDPQKTLKAAYISFFRFKNSAVQLKERARF